MPQSVYSSRHDTPFFSSLCEFHAAGPLYVRSVASCLSSSKSFFFRQPWLGVSMHAERCVRNQLARMRLSKLIFRFLIYFFIRVIDLQPAASCNSDSRNACRLSCDETTAWCIFKKPLRHNYIFVCASVLVIGFIFPRSVRKRGLCFLYLFYLLHYVYWWALKSSFFITMHIKKIVHLFHWSKWFIYLINCALTLSKVWTQIYS